MKISNYIYRQSLHKSFNRVGNAILFGIIIKEYKQHGKTLDSLIDTLLSITDIHTLTQIIRDYKDIELA